MIAEILLHESPAVADEFVAVFYDGHAFLDHGGLAGLFIEHVLNTFVDDIFGVLRVLVEDDLLEGFKGMLKGADLVFEALNEIDWVAGGLELQYFPIEQLLLLDGLLLIEFLDDVLVGEGRHQGLIYQQMALHSLIIS